MTPIARAVRSEWRRMTATNTWWVLALVLTGYAAMMAAPFGFIFSELLDEGAPVDTAAVPGLVYSTAATFGYVVPLVLGALAATNELRHHTLSVTFAVEPRRGRVLVGKVVALVIVGVVVAIGGLVGVVGAGAPLLAHGGIPTALTDPATWSLMGRVVVVLALWAVLGFGVGLIVKNQAFAIVLAIAFTQLVEPVARMGAQFWDWTATVAKYLPGSAMDAFVGASVLNDLSALDPNAPAAADPLGNLAGFAVLLTYTVIALAIGWAWRLRADVT